MLLSISALAVLLFISLYSFYGHVLDHLILKINTYIIYTYIDILKHCIIYVCVSWVLFVSWLDFIHERSLLIFYRHAIEYFFHSSPNYRHESIFIGVLLKIQGNEKETHLITCLYPLGINYLRPGTREYSRIICIRYIG